MKDDIRVFKVNKIGLTSEKPFKMHITQGYTSCDLTIALVRHDLLCVAKECINSKMAEEEC